MSSNTVSNIKICFLFQFAGCHSSLPFPASHPHHKQLPQTTPLAPPPPLFFVNTPDTSKHTHCTNTHFGYGRCCGWREMSKGWVLTVVIVQIFIDRRWCYSGPIQNREGAGVPRQKVVLFKSHTKGGRGGSLDRRASWLVWSFVLCWQGGDGGAWGRWVCVNEHPWFPLGEK